MRFFFVYPAVFLNSKLNKTKVSDTDQDNTIDQSELKESQYTSNLVPRALVTQVRHQAAKTRARKLQLFWFYSN